MSYDSLIFEVRDQVAHVTLNRPDALNTLDVGMATELADAALRCGQDRAIGAVLLSGAGKAFCAGGDLRTFLDQGDEISRYIKELTTHLHTAISRFARMDPPVIAAVHSAAAGGGMSLACSCDLIVAAQSARFTMAYTRIGLTPDGSSSYFLPRLVGFKRAMELTLTNRALTAQEALEWGIVTRVVADTDLRAEAEALARQLAAGPTGAFGAAKRLLHQGWAESLETQMAQESEVIAAMAGSRDAWEGIAAFLEKRRPAFEGSS
jgi:2-(1,2-epoxy-1,2-dihydrophenyl)acetyl-CoA isomerase